MAQLKTRLGLSIAALLALSACDGGDGASDSAEQTVTVLGVIVGEQQEKFEEALKPFEEETGIDVIYEGTDSFATLLPVRVESGDAPDIAMFPQPGLMASFAESGQMVPVTEFMDEATLAEAYPDTWLSLATVDDSIYGIWYRASVKSLVWYNPTAFAAQGFAVPTSWDELLTLSDQIVAAGATPWCVGLESGEATGWPGTDWVEDIMLRTAGPDVYDQWINHEIPFNDGAVQEAFEEFGNIVLNESYVVGGSVGAISTPFGDAPQGLFGDTPTCYLHRQANFIATFFPEDVNLEEDVDIFLLPGIDPAYGTPVLVAGDVFGMFNNTPEAQALMEYLATPTPHEIWAGLGGFLSPHKQVSLDAYPDALSKKQAEFLSNAETIRFDGSDMMPGAVGTGTFWSGVVEYVAGEPVEEVLDTIEASWPE
ncbi:abc transporter substrate-binding protein [Leptolyngbya sp. Heron Island J]|uniref:ABC transporter substrate-binding protein n=1 Tax=Leptolyngbya sp. Heron Island J TaxID=1385935 RepID=UPI0003B9EDD1|nr:ABC transporter substrate-binding protein [Leptolyngbya sp. Heron Island J]ESA32965.1 abc transporter substrate-binding protein [Leptolyngbya sp. Heron Island J]